MKRYWLGPLALGVLVVWVAAAATQPPGGQDQRPGRPGGRRQGPPSRMELGKVLPPHAEEELGLTKAQQAEIAKLEKEVKERLSKILTAEQKRKLENMRPMGPPPGGFGPPPGDDERRGPPPGGERRPDRPERPDADKEAQTDAGRGIQWFTSWERGRREAQRSGRPILFVSAAPHCAGVSGIW